MTYSQAVLSIDFELLTHLPAYRSARGRAADPDVGLSCMSLLLDIFEEHDVEATLFVVADIAERYPDVVRRAAEAGHEIGSHTHTHPHLTELDPDARRKEIERSKALLEDVTGATVSGFRAPSFDIPAGHFETLDAAGYRYDTSVVPSRSIPGWYGGKYRQPKACTVDELPDGPPLDLVELPVSVMPWLRLPLSGTWLRFFGTTYAIRGMRLLAGEGIPPVLYVHPWELATLPTVEGMPRRVYWRTGDWMRRAVERIVEQPFEFVPARTIVEDLLAGEG